mgnify:CR=1 FL=1
MLPLSVPNSTPAAFCVIIVQGDTQLVDIAGNEGHACPGDANDQEIGNGLHKSNHSNGTRDGQKPLRMAEAGDMSPKTTGGEYLRGRETGEQPHSVGDAPQLNDEGQMSFSYRT